MGFHHSEIIINRHFIRNTAILRSAHDIVGENSFEPHCRRAANAIPAAAVQIVVTTADVCQKEDILEPICLHSFPKYLKRRRCRLNQTVCPLLCFWGHQGAVLPNITYSMIGFAAPTHIAWVIVGGGKAPCAFGVTGRSALTWVHAGCLPAAPDGSGCGLSAHGGGVWVAAGPGGLPQARGQCVHTPGIATVCVWGGVLWCVHTLGIATVCVCVCVWGGGSMQPRAGDPAPPCSRDLAQISSWPNLIATASPSLVCLHRIPRAAPCPCPCRFGLLLDALRAPLSVRSQHMGELVGFDFPSWLEVAER